MLFRDRLEQAFAGAVSAGSHLGVLFVDLDDFKDVNDTLGHQAGDRVLQSFAGALRGSLRASDLAGRMGGDEFAAYLLEADDEAGTRLIARLHERLKELGDPSEVSFSAGTAHYPDDAVDVDGLFRRADERLYSAKRASAT